VLAAWTIVAVAQEPTLDAYMDAAVAHDPRGAIARASTDTARADVGDAGAALLPTVRGTASWTYNQFETVAFLPDPAGGPPDEIVIVPQEQYQAALGVRVPLVDGPAFARWRGLRYGVDAGADSERAVEQDVRIEVARAWYAAIAATQVVAAAERARGAAEENLRYVSLRAQAGAATGLSVQRAELAVANAELLRIDALKAAADARRALGTLSGLPEPATLPDSPPLTADSGTEEDAMAAARENRAELTAARARVEQLRLAERGAWLQWAPSVAATGSEQVTNASGFSGESASWRVGVEADWLLLDFGDRAADTRRARAALASARAELARTEDAIRDEVRSSYLDLQSAVARVEAARRGATVGSGAADEARLRFQAGTATQVEVIEAERDALDAEVQRIRAEGELAIARLALQRASGQPVRP
jgi:outer membrane protein TolC